VEQHAVMRPNSTETLHPRNLHRGRYDFTALVAASPELKPYIQPTPAGLDSIDFSVAAAVLALNQALLRYHYKVQHWGIPAGYLCPPIPGRADYIHHLADLLARSHGGEIPRGRKVLVLDVGTGANCIYPIIGSQVYGWKFIASEIDPVSVRAARTIVEVNLGLKSLITVKRQQDPKAVFEGILPRDGRVELTLCNPPFHGSQAEAEQGARRKIKNLKRGSAQQSAPLNFGGQAGELACAGGELGFITRMIRESVSHAEQVGWFSSLVSKSANLKPLQYELADRGAREVEIIEMRQGQKTSRLIAWRF